MGKPMDITQPVGEPLADALRELIMSTGKPVKVVVQEVAVPRSTMYRLLTEGYSNREPNMEYLRSLADYFGCDLTKLTAGLDGGGRSHLTEQEESLIDHFRQLDREDADTISRRLEPATGGFRTLDAKLLAQAGKLDERGLKRLLETADDLVSSGKYIRMEGK